MRRLVLFLSATSFACFAADAIEAAKLDPAAGARRTVRIYTECLVQGAVSGAKHKRVVAFLSRSASSPETDELARALVQPDCLRGAGTGNTYVAQLRFKPMLLRGGMFRALYLKPVTRFGHTVVQPAEIAGSWSDQDDASAPLRAFGDCVVAADHAGADRAIRQVPGSAEEAEAYRALGPSFNRCVVAGNKIAFSYGTLESVLAESLYRQVAGLVPAAKTELK